MALHVLGVNHRTAPLEVREKLAFPSEAQGEALADLAAQPGVAEAVLVSTCNRTEVYCRADDEAVLRAWLEREAAKSGVAIGQHLYAHCDDAAVRHAFRVAAGLENEASLEQAKALLAMTRIDVRRTEAQRDIGVLITDHNVRETLGICSRAYILNNGTLMASGSPSEILSNKSVREVYLGEGFSL